MTQPISNLAVGAKIKIGTYKVENSATAKIIWLVADKNHAGYPGNSITLVAEKIIDLRGFDAKEPGNANSGRASNGNARYRSSNLRQWLNSAGAANAWWTAQNIGDGTTNTNNKDATPNDAGFDQLTGYADIPGFLNNFTSDELANILDTTIKTAKNTNTDSGGSEDVVDKVFLLSCAELGFANYNNIAEGSLIALFNTASYKTAYLTQQAYDNTLSTAKPAGVGTAHNWWLRTPDSTDYAIRVRPDGLRGMTIACEGDVGLRPAMNIANDLQVSDTTDADGCYIVGNTTVEPIEYIEPKLNWTADDYYNAEDLNRVESNLKFVADYFASIQLSLPALMVINDRDITNMDYLSSINRVERNLDAFTTVFIPPHWQGTKVWALGTNFSYRDANRLETNIDLLYVYVQLAKDSFKYCGTLSCGEDGDIY
jgi:hypothetical protein